jgi:hypothetical protein
MTTLSLNDLAGILMAARDGYQPSKAVVKRFEMAYHEVAQREENYRRRFKDKRKARALKYHLSSL